MNMPILSDTALLAAKLVGAVFAGVYGLYATMTDFHEKKHGRQVLSKTGKWGVALLLFATLVNTGSDGIKQKQDLDAARKESTRRDEETKRLESMSKQVSKQVETAGTASTTLSNAVELLHSTSDTVHQNLAETERLLDPIPDQVTMAAWIVIPDNQGYVDSYLKRLDNTVKRNLFKEDGYTPAEGFPQDGPPALRPEWELHAFLTGSKFLVSFRKRTRSVAGLQFLLDCSPPYSDTRMIHLNIDVGALYEGCNGVPERSFDDGSFHSNEELSEAVVLIELLNLDAPLAGPVGDGIKFSLHSLSIYLAPNGSHPLTTPSIPPLVPVGARVVEFKKISSSNCPMPIQEVCFAAHPKLFVNGKP